MFTAKIPPKDLCKPTVVLKNGIRIALGRFPEALETFLTFFGFGEQYFSKMALELL